MRRLYKVFCIFLVIVGLVITFLPQISNYIFTRNTDVIVRQYSEQLSDDELDKIWNNAVKWNKVVNNAENTKGSKKKLKKYEDQLNINGMMGYISIPSVSVQLPIYHGTNEKTLLKGVGHLQNSSLPVGGKGTHCVLTGHTGISTAELFNKIIDMKIGDKFHLTIAGHVLTYEVENVATVLPQEVDLLKSKKNKDLCTLVTCTPYGINTHRLLVRGVRVKDEVETNTYYINDKKDYNLLIIVSAVILILIIIIVLRRIYAKRKKNN